MSLRRRWISKLSRLIGIALPISAWPGCTSSEGPALGGETNWLRWCESDADCSSGACVCGVCTLSCSAEAPSCAAGPADSSCFARGSFPHAALCTDTAAEGICLPACATDADCREGTACRVGACSPEASSDDATGAAPAFGEDARLSALASFSDGWFDGFDNFTRSTSVLPPCVPSADDCPTLEQVLSNDECYDVRQGCGLYYVASPESFRQGNYWYESFGQPPVALIVASEATGDVTIVSNRSVDCDAIEVMCSTCGVDEARCEHTSGAFPEPPPAAPPTGCSCEPEGENTARMSLECFCSVYDCPESATDAAGGCDELGGYMHAGTDTCGQVWFDIGYSNSVRFTFEAATGLLVGARASSGGPITAPCNTFNVVAGTTDCQTVERCGCGLVASPPSCESVTWFGSL